jgi:predicted DNA-binding WGR domain protein
MRIFLQTPPSSDSVPRFYHLFLQKDLLGGWTLVREWGFQGAAGRLQREHFPSHEAAAEAMLKSRDLQISRGYRVMFMQGDEPPI